MNAIVRRLCAACACVVAAAGLARAQGPAPAIVDSGTFTVILQNRRLGTETWRYERAGDSLTLIVDARGAMGGPGGRPMPYHKTAALVSNATDFGLIRYNSEESFDGHMIKRMAYPGDTVVTALVEVDERGSADKLVAPPGRLFVIDGRVFALYDVIARNLHGHIFGPRPVQMVALGKSEAACSQSTATLAGRDSVRWGGKPLVCERIELEDGATKFVMWVSPRGQLLRLENAATRMIVLRDAPPPPRRRAPARPGASGRAR